MSNTLHTDETGCLCDNSYIPKERSCCLINRKELEARKLAMVKSYRDSGLSAAHWCNDNQIKLSNLRYWISRFNRDQHSVLENFIEYHPECNRVPVSVFIGDIRIELRAGFDAQALKDAVFLLKSL